MKNGKLYDHLSVVCMVVILLLVVGQVVMRYVFDSPLTWSEELAVCGMVYLTFIGSVMAMRDKEHIDVNIVYEFLPERFKRYFRIFSRLMTTVFLLVIIVYGFQLTSENFKVTSVATKIPMAYIYGIIPICALCMLYYNLKWMKKGE
jgi:TRAP-type C4-dicarboxylate transport system permease small subunit